MPTPTPEPIAEDTPGGVWIINGTSSAGKSTLVEELRLRLRQPTLGFSIDYFFRMGHWHIHQQPDGFRFQRDADSVRIAVGPLGEQLLLAWRRACAALWFPGVYVTVDDVRFADGWQAEWRSCLKDVPHIFIGVHCDLATLERREQERGNREIGLARGHFVDVHNGVRYDVEVDSARLTVEEAADEIAAAFGVGLHQRPRGGPEPTA